MQCLRQLPALDARLDFLDDVLLHLAGERETLVLAADARHGSIEKHQCEVLRLLAAERVQMPEVGTDALERWKGGTLRSVTLVATGKPGNLQIRLIDPATGGTRQGRGACTGDSGGPVFADDNGQLAVIGVVSWSTGPNAGDGCGGLTGVTPLELYRGWIAETSRKIGGR